MTYLVIDVAGGEHICSKKPLKNGNYWCSHDAKWFDLPKGTIKKLTGKEVSFKDEPIKLEALLK